MKSLNLNPDFRIWDRRRSFCLGFEINRLSLPAAAYIVKTFFRAAICVHAMWQNALGKDICI